MAELGDFSRLPVSGRVIVGLSGGADSCALAHLAVGRLGPGRVILAHVHHGLRGEEADGDEAFCRDFAAALGVEIAVAHADVAALAKARGESLEQCGRAVRYAFFDSLAPGAEDRILTAHTADDNAETLLLNLTRGAGPEGLCGIPIVRGKVLRPLLAVSRAETEAYCAANHIAYRTDSSNFSKEYARNRIRLEVLPILKAINPGAVRAMGRTAALQREERAYLEGEITALLAAAKRPHGLGTETLRAAPDFLRRAALKRWLEGFCPGRLESRHVALAESCLESGGAMTLPGGLRLDVAQGVLSVEKPGESPAFRLPVAAGETLLPNGKRLRLTEISGPFGDENEKINKLLFKNALDCAIINADLVARSRLPGDRFAPAGRGITKPLKQIFQELGLPAVLRGDAVLLESGGKLAYCEGAGAAEEFRVTGKTQKALLVAVEAGESSKEGK